MTATAADDADTFVWSSCNVSCGSRCPLRVQVRDGQIVRVLPDDTGDDTLGGTITRSWPPAETPVARLMSCVGGETFVTQQTKKLLDIRTIVIDPRYSETALGIADEWIALRPGTDTALIAGVAHVMISEDLVDQEFLDTCTIGFDEDHTPEEARTNEKYPLQVIGHHYKQRTHSTYGNVDWMREAHPQVVWMNPIDATARGVENDDLIEVFNDRGRLRQPVRVTPRITPGVLSVPRGAWYSLDKNGVDVGGAVNTLTSWRPTAIAKGDAQHTALVQVEKA